MADVVELAFEQIIEAVRAYVLVTRATEPMPIDVGAAAGASMRMDAEALDELVRCRNDPIDYLDRIDSELRLSYRAQTGKNRYEPHHAVLRSASRHRHATEADHWFGYMIGRAVTRRGNAMVTGSRGRLWHDDCKCRLYDSFVSFSY